MLLVATGDSHVQTLHSLPSPQQTQQQHRVASKSGNSCLQPLSCIVNQDRPQLSLLSPPLLRFMHTAPQAAPSPRTLRDQFDDTDAIQDSDLQYGARSSPQHARSFGSGTSSQFGKTGRQQQLSRSSDDKGKGRERDWQQSHRGKGRLLKTEGLKDDQSPIQRLPLEALGQVFARLPPQALLACSLVCHDWHEIIREDSTWRAAFLYHFCLTDNLAGVPGNRIAPESWQAEFLKRYNLAQKWTKSKISTITHDPRIGNISLIHADIALERHARTRTAASWKPRSSKEDNSHGNAPSMISVSVPRGTASRSDPFSGKVAKGGFIEGAPMPVFIAGLGANLDTVTAAAVSKDGSILAWGMANGSIHTSRTGLAGRYIHGQGQRAAPPTPVGEPFQNHFGAVTIVTFIEGSDVMVSAATDGTIKMWEPLAGCIWTSPQVSQMEGGRMDDIEVLASRLTNVSSSLAFVVAGTRAGIVYTWTFDIKTRAVMNHQKLNPLYPNGETPQAVAALRADNSGSILLVHYESSPAFYRVKLNTVSEPVVVKYGHEEGYIGQITVVKPMFAEEPILTVPTGGVVSINGQDTPVNIARETTVGATTVERTFSNLSYVIAGDEQGRAFIWDWEATPPADGVVRPMRQLQGFETKITSIEVTDLLIMLGTADGMIRAFDLLSGRLVRIFNERSAPRQALRHLLTGQADADEEAKWAVSQIVASREGFVASIGARILAWRAGDSGKASKKTPRSGGRLSSRAERYKNELELKQDIRESTAVLDHEHADRMLRMQANSKAQELAGIPKSLGDMTDEEALALAMMMSREDEEKRQARLVLDTSTDELDNDIAHLRLEEEEDGDESDDGSSEQASRASSHGIGTSRSRASRTDSAEWRPRSYDQAESFSASSYMRHNLSPLSSSARSNSKLQVSPRLNPYLFSTARSPSPVPDLNEASDWPLPSPVSAASPAQNVSRASPGLDASSPSPKLGPASSWSAIARGSPALQTGSPHAKSPMSSLLTSTMPAAVGTQTSPPQSAQVSSRGDDDLDDELRFVLELSRAEEESRKAALRDEDGRQQ